MSNVKEVIEKIDLILDQFLQEEQGNRLSQFSLKMLKQIIDQELSILTGEVHANKPEK